MPVVVDLWAPWCGPCRTLGPIIEKVVDATDGKVVLVKVNVDENPAISQAFRVQSIPAVYALRDGQVVDGFVGAYPEPRCTRFVQGLLPTEEENEIAALLAAGDEVSLRQVLEREPGNEDAIVALGELLVERGDGEEALALLERIPESERTRKVAAAARLGSAPARRLRRHAHRLAAAGEGRRRRPPGVRRHPRADGSRRPAHRRVPAQADGPVVLTPFR